MFKLFSQIDPDAFNVPHVEANDSAIQSALSYIFAIIGGLSVLMVIIGGIRYIVSAGDPQRISTSKNTILYAIIGLVISVSAYVIVNFIFNAVENDPTDAYIRLIGLA